MDPSGEIILLLLAGFVIGSAGGAIGDALSRPGQSLGDMLGSGSFSRQDTGPVWRSVLVGAAVGIDVGASLGAAVLGYGLTGALSAGAAQVTGNLLTGRPWRRGGGEPWG